MWRVALLVIANAAACAAQIVHLEFRARYGEPYVQRYRLDAELSLAARYDDSGAACAFQISPPDFIAVGHSADAPTAAIDLAIDRLVPRYLAEHNRSSGSASAGEDIEDLDGWRIKHERPFPFSVERTPALPN